MTAHTHRSLTRLYVLVLLTFGYAMAQHSQNAQPLVICRGLAASVTALRHMELIEHTLLDFDSITATPWLSDCVWIDPCTATFRDGRPAPMASWLHFDGRFLNSTRDPHIAFNAGVEFARVPAGLSVQACEPNFDVLRRTGQHVCNEDTLVTIVDGACPPDNAANHSLLDCVRPLQHAATQIALHWRPADEKMHFGTLTRAQACFPPPTMLADTLCQLSNMALIHIPVPGDGTAVRLLRYELLPGFTCAAADADHYHSRARPPRRLLACPTDPRGTWTPAADLLSCELTCAAGFIPADNVCVSTCQHLPTSCPRGFHAVSTCSTSAGTHYECEECTPPDGHQTLDWGPLAPCAFEACDAGTFRGPTGDAHLCTPCPLNTFSGQGAAACTHCNTTYTGLYQSAAGSTACYACVAPVEPPHTVQMTVTLATTLSEFDATAQQDYTEAVAETSGVDAADVTIVSIEENSGRRLLSAAIDVTTDIKIRSDRADNLLASKLTTEKLAAKLQAKGRQFGPQFKHAPAIRPRATPPAPAPPVGPGEPGGITDADPITLTFRKASIGPSMAGFSGYLSNGILSGTDIVAVGSPATYEDYQWNPATVNIERDIAGRVAVFDWYADGAPAGGGGAWGSQCGFTFTAYTAQKAGAIGLYIMGNPKDGLGTDLKLQCGNQALLDAVTIPLFLGAIYVNGVRVNTYDVPSEFATMQGRMTAAGPDNLAIHVTDATHELTGTGGTALIGETAATQTFRRRRLLSSDPVELAFDCPAGRQVVTDWPRVQHLFQLYDRNLDDYYAAYCALGYACLPCEPGFYASQPGSAACTPCAFGAFNPNLGATACTACAHGQNTTTLASNAASDCVCNPGFE